MMKQSRKLACTVLILASASTMVVGCDDDKSMASDMRRVDDKSIEIEVGNIVSLAIGDEANAQVEIANTAEEDVSKKIQGNVGNVIRWAVGEKASACVSIGHIDEASSCE